MRTKTSNIYVSVKKISNICISVLTKNIAIYARAKINLSQRLGQVKQEIITEVGKYTHTPASNSRCS